MILLLFFVLAFAKQNFIIEPTGGASLSSASSACFSLGKCIPNIGCCSGQGKCQSNGTTATCVCRSCPGSGTTYYTSASNCASLADSTAFAACCGSDPYDFHHNFDQCGYCNQRDTGVYKPELGAKGNLGRHIGSPNFGDGYSSNQTSFSVIQSMIANLTSISRNVTNTTFTMFAVGALQVALKDVYDPKLSTSTFVLNGHTYYYLETQNNTGVPGSPRAVENTATTVIDLGPLYDRTSRQTRSGLTLPYLSESAAGTYWSNTHHVTEEFSVIIEMYAHYHNYVVHNLEDVLCGENSISANIDYSGCRVYTEYGSSSNQDFSNFIFETARRSTIRFSQVLLQQSTLQIILENPINQTYREEPAFEYAFHRDLGRWGVPEDLRFYLRSLRQHQEFSTSAVTGGEFAQYILSGIDVFLSLRNPDMNLAGATYLGDGSQCGISVGTLANKIINLIRTPARRFGGRIDPKYSEELEVIFHRINELGLADYKTHAQALTDSVSVSDLASGVNVFFGIMNECNRGRQFRNSTASVAVAAAAAIGDAIWSDPTNYYFRDNATGWPTGHNYHPYLIDTTTQDFCFGDCTGAAYNAWNVISEQNDFTSQSPWAYESRSFGSLFKEAHDPQYMRYDLDLDTFRPQRYKAVDLLTELAGSLFYQYDGPATYPFWYSDFSDADGIALPNSVTDALPYNLGWRGLQETMCYKKSTTQDDCRRDNVKQPGAICNTSTITTNRPNNQKPSW